MMKIKTKMIEVHLPTSRPHTAGSTVLSPGGRVEHHVCAGWSPVTLCHTRFRGKKTPLNRANEPENGTNRWVGGEGGVTAAK